MTQSKTLAAKADELLVTLEEWAKTNDVLGPGEILIFSLRIGAAKTVVRDAADSAASTLATPASEIFGFMRVREYARDGPIRIAPSMADRARAIIAKEIASREVTLGTGGYTMELFLQDFPNRSSLYKIKIGETPARFLYSYITQAGFKFLNT